MPPRLVVRALLLALAGVATAAFVVVVAAGDAAESTFQLAFLLYVGLGLLVLDRRPGHPVGALLAVVGGAVLGSAALDVVAHATDNPWMRWAQGWIFVLGFNLAITVLLLLLPEGRPPSPRWGWWVRAVAVVAVLEAATVALRPGPVGDDPRMLHLINPVGVEPLAPALAVIDPVLLGLLALGATSAVLSLVLRWSAQRGRARRQLAWVLLGVLLAVALVALAMLVEALDVAQPVVPALAAVAFAAPALGIAVAILREQLFDIEFVVSRTVVYAAFLAVSAAAYGLVFSVGSLWLVGERGVAAALLAAGVVMALLTSLQTAAHRRVHRALFGDRSRSYEVLHRLGAIAEHHDSRVAELADLVVEVRRSLQVPWVAVERPDMERVVAGVPGPADHLCESLPLVYGGRRLGSLEVARRKDECFRADEVELLTGVAARIATSVWAVGAVEELSAARVGLVRSREEERTRIRRDLHDDVGPVLAAATLQVDALARRLEPGDDRGLELATRVKDELQRAVSDIRALLDGLRPPALDRGLLAAVNEHAESLRDAGIEVGVDIDVPGLEPAVEVAAYRIAAEAMTNVLRHAGARHCWVTGTLDPDGTLTVDVLDDGVGLAAEPVPAPSHVGLASMRARASELGGSLSVGPGPSGGGRVLARIPGGTL